MTKILTLALAALSLTACVAPGYYDDGPRRHNPNEVYYRGGPEYRSERGPGGYYYQQDGSGAGWNR